MSIVGLLHIQALTPADVWRSWSWTPAIVLPLLASSVMYVRGVRAVWRAAGHGRGVRIAEAGAFAAGWAVLVLALVSPLHRLGETLLSAHMAQHELLMAVAAPLLVLGRPLISFLWALPPAWRRVAGSWSSGRALRAGWEALTHPLAAWGLHGLAIWIWHVPTLYQATLVSEGAHAAQHASFLGTGLLFWWTVLRRRGGRVGTPAAIVALFTTALHTSLLGALLVVSTRMWYPIYGTAAAWGLTPLEDQQLAGLIMWVPGGLVYAVAALILLATWLRESSGRRVYAGLAASLAALLAVGLAGCDRGGALSAQEAARLTGGDPHRGAEAVRRFGCGSCHVVPGIPGARGQVGPPLAGIGGRAYIAGVLTNTPDHLARWIEDPRRVDSLTAMPNLGVSNGEARDIAAYLYTLR
jgi:cytochrome c oxidase assembly factor CtaG/cytochrome c2